MDAHLRDLRYFVAVADELHVTRAAERLFISQPALSKQIRQLESQLRVSLFERHRSGVTLTAAGAALLPTARQLLLDWDQAQRAVSDAAAYAAAVLRVGISTSVGRGLLPAITCAFTERRPGWQLQIRQIGWDDPTVGLEDGSTDVALRWLPVPNPEEGAAISWHVLATEPRWVAMPAKHRLASLPEIDFADLLDEPFLALPASAGPLRDYWLATDHRGGRPVRVAMEVRNADETFEAIGNCAGIVLLSEGNAAIYHREGVTARPVHGLSPSELAVTWRTGDHRAVIRDFLDACRSVAATRDDNEKTALGVLQASGVSVSHSTSPACRAWMPDVSRPGARLYRPHRPTSRGTAAGGVTWQPATTPMRTGTRWPAQGQVNVGGCS